MQIEARKAIYAGNDVVLLSPTGSGKTLAFLLPLIERLDPNADGIQAIVLVPSRELAMQIEQVARQLGSGFKINAVYGGRSGQMDKADLKTKPALLIGTPGRIADRFRRDDMDLSGVRTLVLDEFDKSLEVGFEREMSEIVRSLQAVNQRILTSATDAVAIPEFLGIDDPLSIDYLNQHRPQLMVKTIAASGGERLDALVALLKKLEGQPGIIFCNFKDSIQRVSEYLSEHNVSHGTFYGGMEQGERERALIKFRNGTHQILLATEAAAEGINLQNRTETRDYCDYASSSAAVSPSPNRHGVALGGSATSIDHRNKPSVSSSECLAVYRPSPSIGHPNAPDACFRSWCVLPVFGHMSTRVKRPYLSHGTCITTRQ